MNLKLENPDTVAAPLGRYSHAVEVPAGSSLVFISGQVPVNPATNQVELGDIRHETRLVLTNIQRILEGCGASLADVVKCSVFLADGRDFGAMNEVYAEFFGAQKPARTTVACQFALPGLKVEIDCIAYHPQ